MSTPQALEGKFLVSMMACAWGRESSHAWSFIDEPKYSSTAMPDASSWTHPVIFSATIFRVSFTRTAERFMLISLPSPMNLSVTCARSFPEKAPSLERKRIVWCLRGRSPPSGGAHGKFDHGTRKLRCASCMATTVVIRSQLEGTAVDHGLSWAIPAVVICRASFHTHERAVETRSFPDPMRRILRPRFAERLAATASPYIDSAAGD